MSVGGCLAVLGWCGWSVCIGGMEWGRGLMECVGGPNVVWCVYRWIVCGSLWVGQCVSVGVLVGRLCVGVDLACCEAVFWGGLCVCGRWVGCWLMTYMVFGVGMECV